MRGVPLAVALGIALVLAERPANAAYLPNGVPAPNFTKPQHLTGTPRSLSEFAGKVVVLFQFGHNCPECLNDGPAFEQEIRQYCAANEPDEVVVLGVDMYNGSDPQVTAFKNSTGAGYLLLRNGALAAGGNLADITNGLGPNDNYVVINKQGIIRFNTYHEYAHGNRYQPDRIRACVDSLVSPTVDVEDPRTSAVSLAAYPNPFTGHATVDFVALGEGTNVQVTVHDVAGRRVATLWQGPAPAGTTRAVWDGQTEDGRLAPAGVYLVHAMIGSVQRNLRLVRIH
jgi:peroxiredoxin